MKKFLLLVLASLPVFAQSPITLNSTIQIDGANYQAIITKPETPGKHPAVFLIGGLGCYSLDNLKPDDTFFQLLSGLTRRGYVTMRVGKNGEGKSEGPPCDSPQSDLQFAVKRSLAGLNALATEDFVDRDEIFYPGPLHRAAGRRTGGAEVSRPRLHRCRDHWQELVRIHTG